MGLKTLVFVECILLSISSALLAPTDDHHVAFSAGLTSTLHIQDQTLVVYDRVFVNQRLGYDPVTGVFTCPESGVYIFHFHAYSSNRDTVMWLELQLNDTPVASVSGYNSHTVGSNTVILKLNHGDRIDVKSRQSQQFSLFGLPDQVYSTFSGFMLYPSRGNFLDSGSSTVG